MDDAKYNYLMLPRTLSEQRASQTLKKSNVLHRSVQDKKTSFYSFIEARETAKIRNRYNQVPHLTQNTTWESDKNTI